MTTLWRILNNDKITDEMTFALLPKGSKRNLAARCVYGGENEYSYANNT